jgi:hypothetical protein
MPIDTRIHPISSLDWSAAAASGAVADALERLERGEVLFFPTLAFAVDSGEATVFSPAILSSSKNASYDPRAGRVGGTTLTGAELERLQQLMERFSRAAARFVEGLLPGYQPALQRARASFRPAEIAGRRTSWRKDDTRLHIDSFPATPVQGRRILRFFSNVNPFGRPRAWRIGEEFQALAGRFADTLRTPWPGEGILLETLRLTKSRRTPYDSLMLQLHDRMKKDDEFQRASAQETVSFPPGSSWLAFTDQVSHGATAGQYQFEQTFLLPIAAMEDERRSPLRVLERLKGRPLV